MERIPNRQRFCRLIESARIDIGLDLTGLTVLTEAASNAFICTSLIAARAGAKVIAITRSSRYGTANEVMNYGIELARELEVAQSIHFTDDPAIKYAGGADLVTNLGFVRPITAAFVRKLPKHAAIALMWEPWELRSEDVDIEECKRCGIPVIGTNEHHKRLQTFEYVGTTAVKMLLEIGIEVFGSRVGVVASDPFGESIERQLKASGANVRRFALPMDLDGIEERICDLDGMLIAEHRNWDQVIGLMGGIPPQVLKHAGVAVVHIAGNVDTNAMRACGLSKLPPQDVMQGYMTANTSYVGPKPVVDLHCAGLRVGADAVRQRLDGGSVSDAILTAESSGFGLRIPGWL